jgi:hypothetical protein
VAVPGERGEAARALGTAVARTRHRVLKAGRRPAEPHGRPPRRAGVSGRLPFRARRRRAKQLCVQAGPCPKPVSVGKCAGRHALTRRLCRPRPRLPGGRATRCAQGRERNCRPAGAPQRRAATKPMASQAAEP